MERWPVNGQFVIARGAKSYVDVLVVGVSDGQNIGLGEGTAIYYEGETAELCLAQVMEIAENLAPFNADEARMQVQFLLPAGAARNALDCALWDLAAKNAQSPLWRFIGLQSEPKNLPTAFTISLAAPAQMEADAAKAAANGYELLKLKLTGDGDLERVAAVHRAAPDARLIVDANESWMAANIISHAAEFSAMAVEMIEQPLAKGDDAKIEKGKSPLPLIADESCHNAADVIACAPYFDGVNIKLDKAGGLTEALKMADAADAAGLKIMMGCMLSTSMAIAPAFVLAQRAHWVDLDGPILLEEDREDGFHYDRGMIMAPKI